MQQPPPPPPPGQQPPFPAPYQGQPGYPYPDMPPQLPRLTGKIALNYGLIFGAILVAAYILEVLIAQQLFQTLRLQYHISLSALAIYSLILTAIFTLIYWCIYFLAGLFAARRAQQTSAATVACLWASLCYFVIYCLVVGINTLLIWNTIRGMIAEFGLAYYLSLSGLVRGLAIVLIVHIGLGIGIGALGGMLGKNLAPKQRPPAPLMR